MGWQRSQGLAHGFLLCQFLCLELFVVVGLLDTERIVEIVVVDGQPHGRELLHDVYLLRRIDLVLLGIDDLPPSTLKPSDAKTGRIYSKL